jgi:HD-GYP domain-containing protein (c-di-GMP phosphodiesterase class II)
MAAPSSLPRAGAIYVTTITVVGLAVVLYSVYQLGAFAIQHKDGLAQYQFYLLAALTLLSSSATVKLPSVPATISISETFVFTSVLTYSPAAGAMIVALDGFLISIWPSQRGKELHRIAFNTSAPALSMWLSGHVYYLFPGTRPIIELPLTARPDIYSIIGPLAAFTLTHFILNSWFIALAVAFETRRPPFVVWRSGFLWLSVNYFGAASVCALLVLSTRDVNLIYIGILIPLLLTLYYTFKIPMARVEDANKHLAQVNALYLSTIETLAMAVDAKDQVTHGHIRRVQAYAVGLARALAVSDPGLIKAIEASALLHDMGKLAIPEHILNKPGKLTDAEFAKMKMHAGLGADILSAIAFPYPVIPIVRHHHENWDGTGYPSGILGTQIPIGARILAVVDCYDALTSDRPYRPRLSDEAASHILLQRRGTMYDPLVVDTFIRVHRSLAPPDALTGLQSETYADIARLSAPEPRTLGDKVCSVAVNHAIGEFINWSLSQSATQSLPERARHILGLLLTITNARAGLIARYDRDRDDLAVISSVGFSAGTMNTRLVLGENLSGWVAANGQPMLNSDAALDLALFQPNGSLGLRVATSVPLMANEADLVGVVTLFSASAFSQSEFDVMQMLSAAMAHVLRPSAPRSHSQRQWSSEGRATRSTAAPPHLPS